MVILFKVTSTVKESAMRQVNELAKFADDKGWMRLEHPIVKRTEKRFKEIFTASQRWECVG